MSKVHIPTFEAWFAALEARHLAERTFPEVRRALQALSSLYVQRRRRLGSGTALDGAGKRAAFALYYGPLHFLAAREVVRRLQAASPTPARIVDLGCGTGAAGAAWALAAGSRPRLLGVDRNAWAIREALWTWRVLGLRGRAVQGSAERAPLPGAGGAVLAAFTVNELDDRGRGSLLGRLLDAGRRGAAVLVIEPLAKRVSPWWGEWSAAFSAAGGRDDEWRFRADLPERLRLLDRAAGLDHGEMGARSLWIAPAHRVYDARGVQDRGDDCRR